MSEQRSMRSLELKCSDETLPPRQETMHSYCKKLGLLLVYEKKK